MGRSAKGYIQYNAISHGFEHLWILVSVRVLQGLKGPLDILNKISLNRNTLKMKLNIDQWLKICSGICRNLTLCFLIGQ